MLAADVTPDKTTIGDVYELSAELKLTKMADQKGAGFFQKNTEIPQGIVTADAAVDRVRLDVYPDGGLGRFRVFGRPTAVGLQQMIEAFLEALPAEHRAMIDEGALRP